MPPPALLVPTQLTHKGPSRVPCECERSLSVLVCLQSRAEDCRDALENAKTDPKTGASTVVRVGCCGKKSVGELVAELAELNSQIVEAQKMIQDRVAAEESGEQASDQEVGGGGAEGVHSKVLRGVSGGVAAVGDGIVDVGKNIAAVGDEITNKIGIGKIDIINGLAGDVGEFFAT